MALQVVGAGVGRTGTNSLKLALEQLLGGPTHHMYEIFADPSQIPKWTAAIEGEDVDWSELTAGYVAQVDWPGASFWTELAATNPDALVILSVRDPEDWYTSASNTIFQVFDNAPPEMSSWIATVQQMLAERFCAQTDDKDAMIDAFVRHNDEVREGVAPERLLEWTPTDGWDPICERLELEVPAEAFPRTNDTNQWRANLGMPPL
jgi:uncharacterized protein YndB with AHSA1/START domain